jgi:hypothetical protein
LYEGHRAAVTEGVGAAELDRAHVARAAAERETSRLWRVSSLAPMSNVPGGASCSARA